MQFLFIMLLAYVFYVTYLALSYRNLLKDAYIQNEFLVGFNTLLIKLVEGDTKADDQEEQT